jgi:hypothetical protein
MRLWVLLNQSRRQCQILSNTPQHLFRTWITPGGLPASQERTFLADNAFPNAQAFLDSGTGWVAAPGLTAGVLLLASGEAR